MLLPSFLQTLKIFAAIACIVCIAYADVPDSTLEWRSFAVLTNPGYDFVEECTVTADGTGYNVIVFNESSGRWNWSLVTVNRQGRELCRTVLLETEQSLAYWAVPCFLDSGTLLFFCGDRIGDGSPFIITIDPSDAMEIGRMDLSGEFPEYTHVEIKSVEQIGDNSLLVAGSGRNLQGEYMLFTAGSDTSGIVEWKSELTGGLDFDLETALVCPLFDGTFMLSFEEDCFPSGGVPLYRIDSRGNEMWSTFIDLDCEFAAAINGFLELRSGNILCSGSFDQAGRMSFRGFSAAYDPALNLLWQTINWYGDHTSFGAPGYTESEEILCTGWTGEEGSYPFEVTDMNALLVFLNPEEGLIKGYCIEEEGSQAPRFVFSGGIGEYFIIGEHTPDRAKESDIFLGRVQLPL